MKEKIAVKAFNRDPIEGHSFITCTTERKVTHMKKETDIDTVKH